MKLLTLSDIELPAIYGPQILKRFGDVDMAISCGDLHYYYLEFIISMLNIPLYYVRGNHASPSEFGSGEPRNNPWGAIDLHKRVKRENQFDLLLAGVEGCLNYNNGPHQYTQAEMWMLVWSLVPKLMLNKLQHGRYLDIFVTHAPPWGIHDDTDLAHQGIKAFRWLINVFQPRYHFHGHIHLYYPKITRETQLGNTTIINTYGFRELTFQSPQSLQAI